MKSFVLNSRMFRWGKWLVIGMAIGALAISFVLPQFPYRIRQWLGVAESQNYADFLSDADIQVGDSPGGGSSTSGQMTFDHQAFDDLLGEVVSEGGWVDYESLVDGSSVLDGYIDELASVDLKRLDESEKLALLINAYNAMTLRLICDHYPVNSIKDIPAAKRWDDQRWAIAGKRFSLNQIEHELIRPYFDEPRIHFALVCAAVGCPPLRGEAYTGKELESQLNAQATFVNSHRTWVEVDRGRNRPIVRLTRLYRWYRQDFADDEKGLLRYVGQFSDSVDPALRDGAEVRWLPYDWKLNDIRNAQTR